MRKLLALLFVAALAPAQAYGVLIPTDVIRMAVQEVGPEQGSDGAKEIDLIQMIKDPDSDLESEYFDQLALDQQNYLLVAFMTDANQVYKREDSPTTNPFMWTPYYISILNPLNFIKIRIVDNNTIKQGPLAGQKPKEMEPGEILSIVLPDQFADYKNFNGHYPPAFPTNGSPVPEPAAMMLFGIGLFVFGTFVRRRTHKLKPC